MITMAETRQLTKGPAFHWFGYYDKFEFDPTDRYVLGMAVEFEGRSPTLEDTIRVGMVDTVNDDAWVDLGKTAAWCWQQGCMLQWLPGARATVLWNDRVADRFVCHILDVNTRQRRTIDAPVYAVSPDGTWAVSTDFGRINDMRPGYGYAGVPDRWAASLAPEESGIWRIRLDTGETELMLSYAKVTGVPWPGGDLSDAKHYFNHLLVSPDGSRFEFLHRWYKPGARHWQTRMFTCKPDGTDLKIVADSGHASHFIWADADHILVCCSDAGEPNMCLINVHTRHLDVIDPDGLPSRDGHFSYLPGYNNEWIVTDGGGAMMTGDRMRPLVLYHIPTRRIEHLASFHLPERYTQDLRVDLHPRVNRAGTQIVVDSAHRGGRQLYLIDIQGFAG
jgi:hypothetical protein